MLSYSIGTFLALVPREAVAGMRRGGTASASGSYPDTLVMFDPSRLDEYSRWMEANQGLPIPAEDVTPSRHPVVPLVIPPWSYMTARIESRRGGGMVARIIGHSDAVELEPGLVMSSEDVRLEIAKRTGPEPIAPPMPEGKEWAVDTEWMRPFAQEWAAFSGRRELQQWRVLAEIMRGQSPVPTGAGKRIGTQLRERERKEVDQVRRVPNLAHELQRALHHEQQSDGKRREAVKGRITVVEGGTGNRIRATIVEPSQRMLMGRPSKSARWTGDVVSPSLPWAWDGSVVVGSGASVQELGEQMITLCAELDPDFHRSFVAVTGEITRNGHCVASALSIHRLRGGASVLNAEERRRYDRHLEILKQLHFAMELPNGRTLEIPAVALGIRDPKNGQQVLYAVPPQAVNGMPTSVVGLLLDETYGHRSGFLLDTRVLKLAGFAYSLHLYLARQWSARMTIAAVEGHQGRQAHFLETVLDATPMRGHWRSRVASQGRPWLRRTVEDALGEIRAVGLHGAAGTATVEWDADDIGQSRVICGDPPPHILEAHRDRNSRRIDGAAKKRGRMDRTGDDRPARRPKKASK